MPSRLIPCKFFVLAFVVAFAANGDDDATPAHLFPANAFEFAKLVEPVLGVPPKVDLSNGVEIPMFKDGERVYGVLESCDNQSRLGKGCISGSVLERFEGRTRSGERLPDVVWVSFGRNGSFEKDGELQVFGSVQMIGYDEVTGATAFFESSDAIAPWVTLDDQYRMHGELPWIDDPDGFNRAFRTPQTTQCVECHQNDPFIHSDFIDAARLPGTDEPVVPEVRTRDRDMEYDLPYFAIGGDRWDMRTIHIDGNGCLECHRIGMSTASLFMSNGWHPNDHMPPNKPGSLAQDFDELLSCWTDGPDKTPGCDWVIPPAGDELGRVVGEDYPFRAAFNEPRERHQSLTGAAAARVRPMSHEELVEAMRAKGMSQAQINEHFARAKNGDKD